ncbi:MAG: bifunctional diaminohydroxyphosphoribosylaminopyrimidine deaminase/5-amino-6-(5-phosphoribosylamino)uracil reductase RibD [Actinomycetaceae bacterium]|nr:bifunctional diaminohydroxyphosphoribosylaminopyrimidine deaminase/5-amino-6-(5-phosphoribosylamino)uracil reductase RibD [Actinomycetaceae bacterium]
MDVSDLDKLLLAATALALRGPEFGGNPQVGCIIFNSDGVVSQGFHRGKGTAHAEVDALTAARRHRKDVKGATALVTLEPCGHYGTTGPCAKALADAGIARVIYAVSDPNPIAEGGAAYLEGRGVKTQTALQAGIRSETIRRATAITDNWRRAITRGRPYTIAKIAQTADGFVAAPDGTSKWITGPAARAHGHGVRASVDAIVVGTGTVRADDPALSVRLPGRPTAHQPRPIVIGKTGVSSSYKLHCATHYRSHDLPQIWQDLFGQGMRRVLIEGGPTLISAALTFHLVDDLLVYVAPKLLGAGRKSLDLPMLSLNAAFTGAFTEATRLGEDVLLRIKLEN